MLSNSTAKLKEHLAVVTSEFDLWLVVFKLCLVTSDFCFAICNFVQLFSLLLLHTSEIRLVARPPSKLCRGVKLHF